MPAGQWLNRQWSKVYVPLSGKIKALSDRFLGRFPEEKRRPILIGLGALAVILFILLISFLVSPGSAKKGASSVIAAAPAIPVDELFIPSEPDFLPKFLLEREPRFFWSFDDIRPYWRNPANTGLWQGIIKSEVDKLMEGVP